MYRGTNIAVTPGVVKRQSAKKKATRTANPSQSEMPETSMQESIAKLAYALWERNGCPEGTAECDWQEAERQLCESSQVACAAER